MRKKHKKGILNFVLTLVLVCSCLVAPVHAEKEFGQLRILEIEPTSSFKFSENSFNSYAEDVEVYNMTMAEFISRTDDVNGIYDIVYIGKKSGSYNALGQKASRIHVYDPQGNWAYNEQITTPDGEVVSEYYSDNDITNLAAERIKNFKESGQLLCLSSSIFSNSMSSTKLYKNFIAYYNDNTVYKFSDGNVKASQIISKYREAHKRPNLKITAKPVEYDGNNYETKNYIGFKFNVENLNNEEGILNTNLYFDYNGDGLFKPSEVAKSLAIATGDGYTINYNLPEGVSGYYDWKLEISDEFGAKSAEFGKTAFHGKEKTIVKVLQIYPSGNTLDLSRQMDSNMLNPNQDLQLDIDAISIDNFCKRYTDNPSYTLNGKYDMVIVGFQDWYYDITSDAALNDLKSFAETKQSLMLTHDTVSFDQDVRISNSSRNYRNYRNWWQPDIVSNIARVFRDYVGQNRYASDEMPIYGKFTYGYTTDALKRAETNNFTRYNKVYQLNEGLITDYPFSLNQSITVKQTHFQYYQLDLEDPDVVVWYTLTNALDGRNQYYTYSKGTVTFSGTGHTDMSNPTQAEKEEHKLFVNTMVKASRGANAAPQVTISGIINGQNINRDEDIDFSFTATDKDFIDETLNCTVLINGQNVGEYDVSNGKPRAFSMTSASLNKIVGNADSFDVKVIATDTQDAEGSAKVDLNYTVLSSLALKSQSHIGILTGDYANVDFEITPQNYNPQNQDTRFRNIKLTVGDSTGLENESWSKANGGFMSTFGDIASPSEKHQGSMSFKGAKKGTFSIPTKLSYDFALNGYNTSKTEDSAFDVDVKSGTINLEVLDKEKRGVEGVKFVLLNSNGQQVTSGITSATGSYTMKDLSTDVYTVRLTDFPKEYNAFTTEYRNIVLNYDKPVQTIAFGFTGAAISNVFLSTIDGRNKIYIMRNTEELINESDKHTASKITFNVNKPLNSVKFNMKSTFANCTVDADLLKDIKLNGDAVNASILDGNIVIDQPFAVGEYTLTFTICNDKPIDSSKDVLVTGDSLQLLSAQVVETGKTNIDNYPLTNLQIAFDVRSCIMKNVDLKFNGDKAAATSVEVVGNSTIYVDVSFDLCRNASKVSFPVNTSGLGSNVTYTVVGINAKRPGSAYTKYDGTFKTDGSTVILENKNSLSIARYVVTIAIELNSDENLSGNASIKDFCAIEMDQVIRDMTFPPVSKGIVLKSSPNVI